MSVPAITIAAFDRLIQFSYNPQPPVLWPGIQRNTPNAGAWLEPSMFPNESENVSWNDESCVAIKGFFQVLVHYRPGTGQSAATALADALCLHFPKGLPLGPARVFKRPWQAPPVTNDDELFIPITISYRGLA